MATTSSHHTSQPQQPQQAGQQQYVSASLYVGDITPDVTEAMLYEVFHSVGPVASIRVCRDSVTRRSLGYAYVNYHSVADAERALDTLNYSNIKTQPCRIMWSHRDPALRKNNIGNVFVKNLDKSIDNKALYDTFSLFGNILSCKVATDDQSRSLGYGFIHFESAESARTSIERVNNMQIGNKTVFVGHFVRKSERTNTTDERFTNIYIKNIPTEWTEEMMKEMFVKFGEVTSAVLKQDSKGRPFGFVNFADHQSARESIDALNGKKTTDTGVVEDDEGDAADEAINRLFVGRAMTKAERHSVLKHRAGPTTDRTQKHRGVNLYIKNLDEAVDDGKVYEAFSPFGEVVSAKVMRDGNGRSRGFGFVCFETAEAATNAVAEMHLKLMMDKPLYVGLAERREQRLARLQQRYRVPSIRPSGVISGPSQIAYGPQVMYGQNMPQQSRGMVGYPSPGSAGMIPWRPRGPFGQTGQNGMPQMPMYPQHQNMSSNVKGGHMGMPRKSHGPDRSQQHQPYKFTSEARNRGDGGAQYGMPAAEPLSTNQLQSQPPNVQKQIIGERLFPRIHDFQPELAGKITGMMLEMENSELLSLLDSDNQLRAKVDEAIRVLQQARTTD
eukprot:GHVO01046374.1.p1 GENE.GHVO01046374.1~~GHVO01046374.1.p1  ORF type:complete len:613 (+),score=90.51 GHVO01046374.1:136-1974(+)